MIFKLADFKISISNLYEYILKQTKEYTIDACEADYSFVNTEQDIEAERKLTDCNYGSGYVESIATFRKIAEWLPLHNAFVFHSACFDVCGAGVAFAAHSGTGKTTHMNLWQEYLGDKMVVVNGDKPIVRFFEDNPSSVNKADSSVYTSEPKIPYAYGTPWNGKEGLGCNMRTTLKHICFIERSETNYVEKADKNDVIDRIFNQVYMPKNPMAVMKTMELINKMLSSCELWIIHCNMEPEAAEVAYKAIFGE